MAIHAICVNNMANFFNVFLTGIHSMQGRTATTRHGVTRKRSTKILRYAKNLFRKNLHLKDVWQKRLKCLKCLKCTKERNINLHYISLMFFLNWSLLDAILNSHWEAWSNKKIRKRWKGCRKPYKRAQRKKVSISSRLRAI